jgi:hypothetical protein
MVINGQVENIDFLTSFTFYKDLRTLVKNYIK